MMAGSKRNSHHQDNVSIHILEVLRIPVFIQHHSFVTLLAAQRNCGMFVTNSSCRQENVKELEHLETISCRSKDVQALGRSRDVDDSNPLRVGLAQHVPSKMDHLRTKAEGVTWE